MSRIHIALNVKDVRAAETFYAHLFGRPATKTRPDYAKFEVEDPSVNLALNLSKAAGAVNHFGIQLGSSEDVDAAHRRLAAAGLKVREEGVVDCCYATQYKIWTTDPDGNEWEFFTVLKTDCCAPR